MRPKKNIQVKIKNQDLEFEIPAGSNLAESLQKNGIYLTAWCHFRGQCGRCAVDILSGPQPSLRPQEILFQAKGNWPANRRLACLFPVKGDLVISIPASSLLKDVPVLAKGIAVKTELNPAIKKYHVFLPSPSLKSPTATLDRLKKSLRIKKLTGINPGILRALEVYDQEKKGLTVIVYDDEEILAIKPGAEASPLVGLAVDLGTTTIVMEAVDLENGRLIAAETSLNHQVKFGPDVISRISHASTGEEKLEELRETIVSDLNRMIDNICNRLRLSPEDIWEAVIAGNSTMNHLFLGVPAGGLGQAPFYTVFSSISPLPAGPLGLRMNPLGKVLLSPNIRSFIGGDIAAGLLAANLFESVATFAFIDLGTNGEIVIRGRDHLIATSTAAGPAFEGMNLSCGTIASDGAIERATWLNNELQVKTINNAPPRGVCGSGLIDLLRVFLERGLINRSGRIEGGRSQLEIVPDIFFTQEDIRQVQLACAAVKTGFRFLLDSIGLQPQDLEALYLAGAFGQELSTTSSQVIGLIPRIDPERVFFLGNTSLAGARLLLLNRSVRAKLASFIDKIEFVSLASEPRFQAYFLAALPLEPWP